MGGELKRALLPLLIFGVFSYWVTHPAIPSLQPWDAVGGCGVGGSGAAGGGASGGVRWIGRGVSGGLLDAELMSSASSGDDFSSQSLNGRLSHLLLYRNTIGLSLPLVRKKGINQPGPSFLPETEIVSGKGDFGLDFSRKFGPEYEWSLTLSMGFPLAKNNYRRKSLQTQEPPLAPKSVEGFLPPDLQGGTGLYNTGLSVEYTIERDRGPVIFSVGYSQSFRTFSGFFSSFADGGAENELWKNPIALVADLGIAADFPDSLLYGYWTGDTMPDPWVDPAGYDLWNSHVPISREYRVRDDEGRPGDILMGDRFGNSLNASAVWGYRTENFVHSAQLAYLFKLTPDWFVRRPDADYLNHTEKVIDRYMERVYIRPVYRNNTRHVWSLGYGLEISFMRFPVFVGTALTLDGRGEPQSVSGNLGVRGSFF